MQKYRAAKYVRLSSADDKNGDSDSDSIINQSKLIDDFVKNNPDIEIVTEKIDDGYSGIIFDRPAFKDMMSEIEAGKIDCVIVKDLSRLGREYIETGRYLRRIFPAYGVRFIAVLDNIDTAKETSGEELAVSLKTILNDSYCRDISLKTRSALAIKRINGDFIGAFTIYGYLKSEENKNQLVIDEYASCVVQDIFKMKIEGMSASKIADTLNNGGILSPIKYKKTKGLPHCQNGFADKEDAKWSATTIIRILKDETYTGTLIQGKQSTPNYKLKNVINKPASEWIRVENSHEAIIKKHDFDLVQKIMRLDTRTSPNKDKVYMFSGILICGSCGNRMTRKTIKGKDRTYYYYFCPSRKKSGCDSPLVKENDLIELVWVSLKSYIENVISLEQLLNNIDSETLNHENEKICRKRISEINLQLEQLQEYKLSLYENLIEGIISKVEHKNYKKKYDNDISQLEKALAEQEHELDDILNNKDEHMMRLEHFKSFQNLPEINRKVVIRFISSIRIMSKENIDISFNYEFEYNKALSLLLSQKEVV